MTAENWAATTSICRSPARSRPPMTAGRSTAAPAAPVYRPVGTNVLLTSSADCHLLALKVDTTVLEAKLAALLDKPVRGPVRLAGQLDVRRSSGRGCAGPMRLIGAEIDNPTGEPQRPYTIAAVAQSAGVSVR